MLTAFWYHSKLCHCFSVTCRNNWTSALLTVQGSRESLIHHPIFLEKMKRLMYTHPPPLSDRATERTEDWDIIFNYCCRTTYSSFWVHWTQIVLKWFEVTRQDQQFLMHFEKEIIGYSIKVLLLAQSETPAIALPIVRSIQKNPCKETCLLN